MIVIGVVVCALAACLCVLVYLARLVVMEPGRHHLCSYRVGQGGRTVIFKGELATQMPGEYGLWFGPPIEGGAHARIGKVVWASSDGQTVEREVIKVTGGDLAEHRKGLWTGHIFSGPDDLNVPFVNLELGEGDAPLPCWIFDSPVPGQTKHWMVHVHGIRTTRLTTLRNVALASSLGFASIVPSFRSDDDNRAGRRRASTLGRAEWPDVDLAIDYAREHGAANVILFGLSLGGMISLLLARRSRNVRLIRALVLIGPVTDFAETIIYGATQLRLPSWVGRLAMAPLRAPLLHRLVGLSERINFPELSVNGAPGEMAIPTLVIHSPIDDEVPHQQSLKLAASNPVCVTLDASLRSLHTCEWNVDPRRFESIVTAWLGAHQLSVADLDAQ